MKRIPCQVIKENYGTFGLLRSIDLYSIVILHNFPEKTGVAILFTIENFAAMGYKVYFTWEFGTEHTLTNVTDMNASYAFTQPGNHLVRLNATNAISSGSFEV